MINVHEGHLICQGSVVKSVVKMRVRVWKSVSVRVCVEECKCKGGVRGASLHRVAT